MAKPGAVSSCRECQPESQMDLSSQPNPGTVPSCETFNMLLNFSEPLSLALIWQWWVFASKTVVKTKRSRRESAWLILYMPFVMVVFHSLQWTLPPKKCTSLETGRLIHAPPETEALLLRQCWTNIDGIFPFAATFWTKTSFSNLRYLMPDMLQQHEEG